MLALYMDHEKIPGTELQSLLHEKVQDLYENRGTISFTKSRGQEIPKRKYDNAIQESLQNWKKKYSTMNIRKVKPKSSIVGNHLVYSVKVADDNSLSLKEILVVHGNEDGLIDKVRKIR